MQTFALSSHLHTPSLTMAEPNPVVFFDIALGGKSGFYVHAWTPE